MAREASYQGPNGEGRKNAQLNCWREAGVLYRIVVLFISRNSCCSSPQLRILYRFIVAFPVVNSMRLQDRYLWRRPFEKLLLLLRAHLWIVSMKHWFLPSFTSSDLFSIYILLRICQGKFRISNGCFQKVTFQKAGQAHTAGWNRIG